MASTLFTLSCVSSALVLLVTVVPVRSQSYAPIGSYCTSFNQCANATPNSYCINNRCQCQPNYYQINNTACSRYVGNTCTNNTSCQIPNSFCATTRVCACLGGFVQFNGSYCGLGIGSPCNTWSHKCDPIDSYCDGSRCKCTAGMQADSTYMRCIPSAVPTANCTTTGCGRYGPGAYCDTRTGNCSCVNGYMAYRDYCYHIVPKVGDKCDISTEICYLRRTGLNGVECKDKKCKCKSGYKPAKDNLACGSATITATLTTTIMMLIMIHTWS